MQKVEIKRFFNIELCRKFLNEFLKHNKVSNIAVTMDDMAPHKSLIIIIVYDDKK